MKKEKTIPLTRGQYTIVDSENYIRLIQWKWHLILGKNTNYAERCKRKNDNPKMPHGISMHRVILGITNPLLQSDHINGNGLDNRKLNLRICFPSENLANRRKFKGGSSKYKGVCWYKMKKKWRASIRFNKKHYHLGYFKNEKSAALAYNNMATKFFGEFAKLNDV